MINMKMTLRMENTNFELEFDGAEEACEFINVFMRNNPKASLLKLSQREKRQILSEAADIASELLGVSKKDPMFKAAVEVASEIIGLNNDN